MEAKREIKLTHATTVRQWRVQVGQQVKRTHVLFVHEPHKVAMSTAQDTLPQEQRRFEYPSPYDGVVEKVLARVGETVKAGSVALPFRDRRLIFLGCLFLSFGNHVHILLISVGCVVFVVKI
jgi:multidrug efflux pump subunit AcrA (membrane-fusion protein)